MIKQFSYNKKEKLKSRKQLEQLFSKGKSFSIFPLKIFYMQMAEQENPVKAGVGVSSRNFKKAVDRNRIKRLLREAYRTEKITLHDRLTQTDKKLMLFLLYIDKTIPEYNLLKEKMKLVIERLMQIV